MKLKYAQDLIKASTQVKAGFNIYIYGGNEPCLQDYGDRNEWYSQLQGYNYAKKMSMEDGIAFTYKFKCSNSENCHPFMFGGFFVCNSCGNKSVEKEWWKIQVKKDGNAFCCHGLDFENLQVSNNYAFGDTFEDAIYNYEKLMLKQ